MENTDSALFVKVSGFLDHERKLHDEQKKVIEAQLPKFSVYRGTRGFNRIVRYTGFVFVDQDGIDPKVWNTKEVEGLWMISCNHLRGLHAGTWTDCWI